MKHLGFESSMIDPADARILQILNKNARISTAELARKIGLSAPSVAERMKRLEEAGIIEGYHTRINLAALGLHFTAWLRIRPVPGELTRVADILRSLPEIVECDRVTGEDCFVARAQLRSVAELERLIDRIIPFAMTNTAIVQSSPVERRLPPIFP
ncbi:MAG: Lrp/AsnC family transcriptional regulator [Rhizobiaceae bacterium]|nr:MAG: Lrp/AsnC family transcriptional regulator [Rhizobiaceae bacterium]